MTEAHCLTRKSAGKTAADECRTICDLLAGHALHTLTPLEAAVVRGHLATCGRCRDEYECLERVATHLPSLREAARGCHGRPWAPPHRSPRRAARAARLTLPQWVSRTTSSPAGPCGDDDSGGESAV